MTKPKTDNTIGKLFEKKIAESLKELARTHGVFFTRFYDTHAAGSYLPASPADFLVAYNSQAQLWECKASVVHDSLKSCLSAMVDDGQVGHHRLWHNAGLDSYFIFYSDQTAMVEFWNGAHIVHQRTMGRKLVTHPTINCPIEELGLAMFELF